MASIVYLDACADVVGTVAGPFAITAGSNDKLQITIDGGSPQTITLTAGAARTATQIAADINATLTGGAAYANGSWTSHPQPSRVRIRTTSTNGASSSVAIGAPANNANATLGFTAATTTGAVRVDATWTATAGTKQELINQIETQLLAAGWTTVSGHATTTLLMQSALTPPGEELQMRLRVKDNAGNCVVCSIENVAGTVAGANDSTHGAFLLPAAAKVWRFSANKYQAWIHAPQPFAVVRTVACFGVPNLPPFLRGGTPGVGEAIWLFANSQSDTDLSARASLITQTSQGVGNWQAICNGTLADLSTPSSGIGSLQWMGAIGGQLGSTGFRWHDSSANLISSLVAWGATGTAAEALYRGQLWDAFVSTESYTGDTSISFDSHTYRAVTDSNIGSVSSARGTLFIAVA